MSPNLSGKVCIVTGGSQGIGKGIALQLGEAGAIVYITGRNKANLQKAAQEVKERGAQKSIPLQGNKRIIFVSVVENIYPYSLWANVYKTLKFLTCSGSLKRRRSKTTF